jgi:broad specificity phosphatase PhoE
MPNLLCPLSNQIWLMRHGETEWSRSGQHTSRTDLPLTEQGERLASDLGRRLMGRRFALVLSSPMRRALETCRLAGYTPEIADDLHEWDYGAYEGLTTSEIQRTAPGWTIWTGVLPGGETIVQVSARADRILERALAAEGDMAVFSHGHMLRVLAARWLRLAPDSGRLLALSTGSVSVLGWERDTRVLQLWNQTA